MDNGKVLIGCPVCDKYKDYIESYIKFVKNLDYKNYDLLLVDNSKDDAFYKDLKKRGIAVERVEYSEDAKDNVVRSRNLLRERAIGGRYDYLLSLEIDLFIGPDVLRRLMAHNKPIVGAYYGTDLLVTLKNDRTGEIKKAIINVPVIGVRDKGGRVRRAHPPEVLNKGLITVDWIGLGCVLIKREVFEKIKFRYSPEKDSWDDFFFCYDAKSAGYECFLDSDVKVLHKHDWNVKETSN